jgi:hypothetical protein
VAATGTGAGQAVRASAANSIPKRYLNNREGWLRGCRSSTRSRLANCFPCNGFLTETEIVHSNIQIHEGGVEGSCAMSDRFPQAVANAELKAGKGGWERLEQRARNAAVYRELCLLDSGCLRTGTSADDSLPPCPATDSFIRRRDCQVSGRWRGPQDKTR